MTDDIIPIDEARRRKEAEEAKPETSVEDDPGAAALVEALRKAVSSQRDKLIACAEAADLWHDADGTGYATLAVRDHVEHYLLRSKGFRLWLVYRYYKAHKGAPSAQPMQDSTNESPA